MTLGQEARWAYFIAPTLTWGIYWPYVLSLCADDWYVTVFSFCCCRLCGWRDVITSMCFWWSDVNILCMFVWCANITHKQKLVTEKRQFRLSPSFLRAVSSDGFLQLLKRNVSVLCYCFQTLPFRFSIRGGRVTNVSLPPRAYGLLIDPAL